MASKLLNFMTTLSGIRRPSNQGQLAVRTIAQRDPCQGFIRPTGECFQLERYQKCRSSLVFQSDWFRLGGQASLLLG